MQNFNLAYAPLYINPLWSKCYRVGKKYEMDSVENGSIKHKTKAELHWKRIDKDTTSKLLIKILFCVATGNTFPVLTQETQFLC